MRFTKGLKKFLSLALTSALVVTGANVVPGLQDQVTKTAKAAGKVVFESEITSWNTGGDGDCRVQLWNTWATPAQDTVMNGDTDLTEQFVNAKWTDIEFTFTVTGVKETLAEAGLEKATAALALETDIGWKTNVAPDANQTITDDGTYTLKYTVDPEELADAEVDAVSFGHFFAMTIDDFKPIAQKGAAEDGHDKGGSLKFSNVKVKLMAPADIEDEPAPSVAPTTAPTAEPSEAPSTEYHAYLAFQTDTYAFRELWTNEDNGRKSKDIKYSSQVGQFLSGKLKTFDATIKDAVIDHNGEYTISISGVDVSSINTIDSSTKKEIAPTMYHWMMINTDIPRKQAGLEKVKVSNVSLTIDDKTVTYKNDLPTIEENESLEYYNMLLLNDKGWNGGIKCEYTTKDLSLAKKTVEVKFTVSGGDFSYKTIGTAKGKTFTSGNFKYKVTTASQKNTAGKIKAGKVALAGLSAKGKKAKSLTLPVTVKNGEASYTVTALNAGAFKGAKAAKITLNKNIKKLPKNTFASCKKLTKITFKKKLTSVNKAAFKGCKKTIKIAGTSAKANLKLIKKKASYKKFK